MGHFDSEFKVSRGCPVELKRFIFLAMPGFSALDLGSGVDALAAANKAAEQILFRWKIVSEDGAPVVSSAGMNIAVEGALPAVQNGDCIVVCASIDTQKGPTSERINAWLRKATRQEARLCGLGGGALYLALIGLAQKGKICAHWRLQPVFEETFLKLDPVCTIYEEEANFLSSAGGAATLDLFLALIRQTAGTAISNRVADDLLCASVRPGDSRQTMTDRCRLQHRNEKLSRAVAVIQDSLEDPLPTSMLAQKVGISTRQLERLFGRYLGCTPKTYMTNLRLDRARVLLQQTHMSVIDVAVACGFSSAGHFSKLYRRQFGISPHIEQSAP
ncbi:MULTISPECIES: GlxA family transcriptional regulator [unclassified Ruegeria]|uniref:GlxA family transcriptional regulator n=1 Tax=unclassified Ruegeria TaxID=2625375 RepID=UPI0014910042|nr:MULTISPECIES: GlxA family transcriptional regulator [unclassified Ruegeria]NOD77812.1 helix-turn-helix domain-containing protein [Ruegeria sp. HKCCD4332]NOD88043.1 helix-turn-helix domain-containing protein [Ruegeria sp. HKCCD4318]NOE14891.1 helix-turn-helix domain-containing protein [Ruegeria sp. HKCCD4318-2]NOG11506.1 GlxA family transcriptional regulator [Ruegeria sp. HKCCD4315]